MNIQNIPGAVDYGRTAAGRNAGAPREMPEAQPAPFPAVSLAKASVGGRSVPADPAQQVLTTEEQEFFAALFPPADQEAQGYHTYSPSGVHHAASSGTIIDRKG